MVQKDVLISDYVHPVLMEGLHLQGYTTTYAPEMSRAEMEKSLDGYKGVVINTRCAIDRPTLAGSPSLRWIARLGSGLDIIDLEAAKEYGVVVMSAPEGNAESVAEHAMGMLLCMANKLISADRSVRQGDWAREMHRGWEIAGKTIGIIGYGNNGGAFGKLWKGWDVRVIAYDKYLNNYGSAFIEEVTLDKLVAESDIISLHIPLTAETREMVDLVFLEKCKDGCILINTSRGKIINLGDLVAALKSGKLRGVCLDVFPSEPPGSGDAESKGLFEELCTIENVILSPHVAGWTVESKRKIGEVLVRKIRDFEI